MTQLILANSIYLPETSHDKYKCYPAQLGEQVDMISGRRVLEVRGQVQMIEYEYDYMGNELMRQVNSVLRSGQSFMFAQRNRRGSMEHINGIKAAVVGVLGCLTALWGWFGWLVVAWVACMVLDYATGSFAALRAGEWSSKAARDGLWHKLGAIVGVLVAAILDGVIRLVLENIPALELPFEYTVFVSVLVLVWYILTELGSIVENAGALGAPIHGWLAAAIKVLGSSVDKAGEAVTGDQDDNSSE